VPDILQRVSKTEPLHNKAFLGRRLEWRFRRCWNPRGAPDLMPIWTILAVAPERRERKGYPKFDD
jgi:hypothetical protein